METIDLASVRPQEEALDVVERTGGRAQVQAIDSFGWSSDAQLWWIDARPGDRLVLDLPVNPGPAKPEKKEEAAQDPRIKGIILRLDTPGGEVAAMVLVEAVSRQTPGVVGLADSVENDSFRRVLLDHPHSGGGQGQAWDWSDAEQLIATGRA